MVVGRTTCRDADRQENRNALELRIMRGSPVIRLVVSIID